MNGTLCGLMAAMLMNSEIVVQSRDGVHNIVSAASRIVRTQTQLEDVLLASLMVKYGLVLKKYRLVQDITMLLRTRSAVSVALESSNHKQKSKPPVSKPKRLGRLLTRITNTNTTRKTNIHF